MSSAPPDPHAASLTPETASELLSLFGAFLTTTVHTLLHHRGLYPPETFQAVRAFNLPVRQSRHPRVCEWVRAAVDAVLAELAPPPPPASAGSSPSTTPPVDRVALLVVHAPLSRAVLERWLLDVSRFPASWGHLHHHPAAAAAVAEQPNLVDVHEALRGALRRIAYAAEQLPSLPDGCSFSMAIELRDGAPVPVGVCKASFCFFLWRSI